MGTVGNFDDIIEEFSADYPAYIVINIVAKDDGTRQYSYREVTVHGSLQTEGRTRVFNKSGANTVEHKYALYSNDRNMLNEGDYVIDRNGNALIITGLDPWEVEGDYRKYSLTRTKYTEKRLLDMFLGEAPVTEDNQELIDELESRMR